MASFHCICGIAVETFFDLEVHYQICVYNTEHTKMNHEKNFYSTKKEISSAVKLIKDVLVRSDISLLGDDVQKAGLYLCKTISKKVLPKDQTLFKKKLHRKKNTKRTKTATKTSNVHLSDTDNNANEEDPTALIGVDILNKYLIEHGKESTNLSENNIIFEESNTDPENFIIPEIIDQDAIEIEQDVLNEFLIVIKNDPLNFETDFLTNV